MLTEHTLVPSLYVFHFVPLTQLWCFRSHLAATQHSPYVLCNPSVYQSIRSLWRRDRYRRGVVFGRGGCPGNRLSWSQLPRAEVKRWSALVGVGWQLTGPTCLWAGVKFRISEEQVQSIHLHSSKNMSKVKVCQSFSHLAPLVFWPALT